MLVYLLGVKFFLIHTWHPAAHVVPDSMLGTEAAGLRETGLALQHMQASGHLEPLRAPGLEGGFHAWPLPFIKLWEGGLFAEPRLTR